MAEFVVSPEQADLRRGLREFLAKHGERPDLWQRLAGELGVLGLAVPEDLGGSGGTLVDQAVAVEELGAALVAGPVLGTVACAIPALLAAGDTVLLPDLVAGTTTAALAAPDRGGRFAPDLVTVTADGDALTGDVAQVVDGDAHVLLVAARTPDGVALYATDGGERRPLSTLDPSRPQAAVTFVATPARLVAADAGAALTAAFRVGATLLAAEQVGGAQRMLDTTVAYAGTRLQFGRPIGSFQAVKHRCADLLVAVEHARSAAYHAAWALEHGTDDPDLAASVAQAVCSEAYRRVALDAVQLHGGIGFTWEHACHRYVKRAVTDAALLGSAAQHREHIAAAVLDGLAPTREVAVAAG